MDAAQPREPRVFQRRDHAKDARLLAVFELGLEPDHVPQRAQRVVLAELHHGIRTPPGLWIAQAHGLHRSEAQSVDPARRHHLDRQAAFEVGRRLLPFVELADVALEQLGHKGAVLLLGERAIDVVRVAAARAFLVVARLQPGFRHVDGLALDDRGDGIEEGEQLLSRQRAQGLRQSGRGEGTRRDDDAVPRCGRVQHFFAIDLDLRMRFKRGLDRLRETHAVDGERSTGRQFVRVGCAHDQRARAAASPRAAARRRCFPSHRSGKNSSTPARPSPRRYALRSSGGAAFRAARRGCPPARPATPLRFPQVRRR